jgi:AcrR family transcriptional regulator
MQQIIDECGCGKNLLYREFPSKDDLVVAWLERCFAHWEASVDEVTAPLAGDPAAQLVAIVQLSADEAARPEFRGCPLRATNAEFKDAEHPARLASVSFLTRVRQRLLDLAVDAGAVDPAQLADRLMLVLDGLLTNAAVLGPTGASPAAVPLAGDIVAAALA